MISRPHDCTKLYLKYGLWSLHEKLERYVKYFEKMGCAQSGGGAGTFLMEHNPKSTRGVGGCFLKFSKSIMVLFLSQKKEGVPQNMIIKVHGTFSLPKC